MARDRKICVGMIAGAHGVRGLVRLRSFTEEPEDIAGFKNLTDETGEARFTVKLLNAMKDHYVAEVKGVTSREAAEELHGTRLYVEREQLPKTKKREYYAADLIGLAAKDGSGKEYGKVLDVHDHGAGVFFEIGTTKRDSFMLPFTDAFVPEMDVEAGSVTINLPEGWLNKEKPPKEGAEA